MLKLCKNKKKYLKVFNLMNVYIKNSLTFVKHLTVTKNYNYLNIQNLYMKSLKIDFVFY